MIAFCVPQLFCTDAALNNRINPLNQIEEFKFQFPKLNLRWNPSKCLQLFCREGVQSGKIASRLPGNM
jgi:hypothetical protein